MSFRPAFQPAFRPAFRPAFARLRDVTAPVVTISSLTTSNRRPSLAGAVDDPTAIIAVTVAGLSYPAVNAGNGTWSLAANTIASLPDGTHPVTVTATDAAGNIGTATGSIYVDATAPSVTFTPIALTNIRRPALTGTVNDPTATVVASIGGNAYPATITGGNWTVAAGTILALTDGTHTVNVTATDPVGNVGLASGTVKVDATAPTVTLATAFFLDYRPPLSGTLSEPATVNVVLGGLTYPATVTGLTWGLAAGTIPALAEGSTPVQIQATDAAGNVGTLSTSLFRLRVDVLLDASDMSTLFQDAAGTTPVTGPDQPVGLWLDKSKGLVLGPELVTGTNSTFTDGLGGWGKDASGDFPVEVIGGQLKATLTNGTSDGIDKGIYLSIPTLITGNTYVVQMDVGVYNITYGVSVRLGGKFDQGGGYYVIPNNVNHKITVVLRANSSKRLTIRTESGVPNGAYFTIDNISVRELPGNHAFQPTSSARPMYRVVGGKPMLQFDGVGSWMQTNNIYFTYTDKMTVVAGVTKLSDAATGYVFELSTNSSSNTRAFRLVAPESNGAIKYAWSSVGSFVATASTTDTQLTAPHAAVISGAGNISGDSAILRVNGSQVAQSTGDQGTGNYGNYPLYIGARGGTTLRFNGYLSSLTIAGKLLSETDLRAVEQIAATKHGVTLV